MTETTVDPSAVAIAKEIQTAVRHSAVYGLGSVLMKAVGFLMVPFYTHYLAPADYGVLEILDLTMAVFGMFLNMGITAALLRRYAAAKTVAEKRTVVATAFAFAVGTGVATFFLLVGAVRAVSIQLLGPEVPTTYLLLSFAAFVLGYVSNVPRAYLFAREASVSFVLVDTGGLVLMLGLTIYFVAVLKMGLLGILCSSLTVAAVQMVVLSAWTIREVGIRFDVRTLQEMVRFGLPLILSNLALFTLNFADRFFLQHLRSLEVVGIYAVGYKFGFMMNYLLVQPFQAMWQSRMYAVYDLPDHKEIFGQIFVFYSLVLTYAALALAVMSPEVIRWMVDARFAASRDVIPIVAFGYVFCGVGYYLQLGMFVMNRTNLIGILSAVAAVLNLGLNYFSISRYGMVGAAWTMLVSFLAIAAGSYWLSQRVFPQRLSVGRVGAAILLALCFCLASRWWSIQSVGATLAIKGALLVAFPGVLWRVGILTTPEKQTLVSAARNAAVVARRRFTAGSLQVR